MLLPDPEKNIGITTWWSYNWDICILTLSLGFSYSCFGLFCFPTSQWHSSAKMHLHLLSLMNFAVRRLLARILSPAFCLGDKTRGQTFPTDQEVKQVKSAGWPELKPLILPLSGWKPQGHIFLSRTVSLRQAHIFRLKRDEVEGIYFYMLCLFWISWKQKAINAENQRPFLHTLWSPHAPQYL